MWYVYRIRRRINISVYRTSTYIRCFSWQPGTRAYVYSIRLPFRGLLEGFREVYAEGIIKLFFDTGHSSLVTRSPLVLGSTTREALSTTWGGAAALALDSLATAHSSTCDLASGVYIKSRTVTFSSSGGSYRLTPPSGCSCPRTRSATRLPYQHPHIHLFHRRHADLPPRERRVIRRRPPTSCYLPCRRSLLAGDGNARYHHCGRSFEG
jgi:hypothetical protein